ncbi:MAG: polysaccharide deacetylase family protein, partial [Bacteroidota bacterium]
MMKSSIFLLLGVVLALSIQAQSTKKMAITIDDLPMVVLEQNDSLRMKMNRDIIAHLSEYDVPAIGFVNEQKLYDDDGQLVPIRKQMLVEWLEAGMELGNHTYSHPDYNSLEPEEFFEEIIKGEELTRPLLSEYDMELKYFRHPFLHRGNTKAKVDTLVSFLSENGYIEAPVTIDNSEWIFARAYELAVRRNQRAMANRIGNSYISYMLEKTAYFEKNAQQLFDRPINQILLLHDNFINADYLGKLLEAYAESGYEFVSLDEALEDPAYRSEDNTAIRAGITWLHRWAITKGIDQSFFSGEPACPRYVQEY